MNNSINNCITRNYRLTPMWLLGRGRIGTTVSAVLSLPGITTPATEGEISNRFEG